jgi:hypothetical protein
MVNNDRIVSVTKTDLLSLVGTILGLNGTSYNVLAASDVEGNFAVTGSGAAGNLLANQPVKTVDFGENVTTATLYFVAGYDFVGFTNNGSAATIASGSVEVKPDGATLYKAARASGGAITITAVTPVVA